VVIAVKLLRKLFKNETLYAKVLNYELFSEIYQYSQNEKFIVSSEIFKLLISLVNDAKISQKIFEDFLNLNQSEVCDVFNTTIYLASKGQDNYFVLRDTLKFILCILSSNDYFFQFKDYFLSQIDNLKVVMSLLNHNCIRIKFKAINLLFFFFGDLETANENVTALLLANKNNFESYFSKIPEYVSDADITEKKTYILYELERLQNIC